MKMTLLILSFFVLVGFSKCEPEKERFMYVVDVPHNVCAKKKIIQYEPKLKFQHVEDLPLIECDGAVAIHRNDWLEFKRWLEELIQEAKKQCLQFVNKLMENKWQRN